MSTFLTAASWFGGFWLICYLASLVFAAGGYLLSRLVAGLRPQDEAQRAAFAPVRQGAGAIFVGVFVEAFFQLVTVSSDIIRLFTGARRLAALPTGTPVLLLPGYLESSGCMVYLGAWLKRRGFRTYLLEYPSTFAPIASNARHVHRRIQSIREETGAERIAVVGHSMGGVIARCVALSEEDHGMGVIVCIASPHQGVTRRAYAPGRSARDMTFGSAHMHAFPVTRDAGLPIHTVVGTLDQIVNPPWATMTYEGETRVLKQPIGHMGPLFVREARQLIERFLEREGVERAAGATAPGGSQDDSGSTLEAAERAD